MLIHHSGVSFLCHPRTASHSISEALIEQLNFVDVGGNYHQGPNDSSHWTWKGNEGPYFCVIRNHWDAMASWWFMQGKHREEEFITVPWLIKWADWYRRNFKLRRKLWYFLYQDLPLTVIRFEDLEQMDLHYAVGNDTNSGPSAGLTSLSVIDNWNMIPEPATLCLLGLGGLLLRRRKNA